MTKKVVTFGEIMMRLSPPNFLRFEQAKSFNLVFGGGEANVAIGLAHLGIPVNFVTRLPDNDLGNACLNYIRQYGATTENIVRGGNRLGIYFHDEVEFWEWFESVFWKPGLVVQFTNDFKKITKIEYM